MLFLGAGASKAVGIDDLQDLTNKIKVQLEKKGYKSLIQHVTDTLENANQNNRFFEENEVDIEVIFSVLNGLAHPVKALKDLGPYAIYVNELGRNQESPDRSLQKEHDIDRIRSIVGQVITSSCNKFNTGKATRFYRELFEFEKDTLKAGRQRLFSHTVTTNYDLVFERCADKNPDIPARIGFRKDHNNEYLPLQKIVLEGQFGEIEYLKLHGSINWWIRDSDKRIVLRDEKKPGRSLMGERYKEQLMIYPVYEKYVSEDPYFSLYYYFRKLLYLHDVYVVIGYSFRDQSINNAFADALRRKGNSRLIIVNSNKKSIEKRINQYFPKEKVKMIEDSFGDTNLIPKLKEVLV
jgi:hypothetical protein